MKIFIIGNFVDFTICRIKSPIRWGESCIASEIKSTIGNDAAIVAIVLTKLGQPIVYGLLNPLTEVIADKVKFWRIQIQNLEINNSGGKTFLIEDAMGKRTFISAYGEMKNLYSIPDDVQYIYFDLYDENIQNLEYLMSQLKNRKDTCLFFNLSASAIRDKCCLLNKYNIGTIYIQFSCDKELAEFMIKTVLEILPEAILIVTCGDQGSYLAYFGYLEYIPINARKKDSFLGAGAFFSAFFLNAIFHKQSLLSAQKYASKNVGVLCEKGEDAVLLNTINYLNKECMSFE